MELSFDVQEEDLRIVQRVAAKALQKASAHWTTITFAILHWMCAGAFAICVLDVVRSGARPAILVLGFAMVGSLWMVWLSQARRMLARQRAQIGPYPQRQYLVMDKASLTVESCKGMITLPWSEVRDLQSTPSHLCFLFGNGGCFGIPERAFEHAGGRAAFVAAVKAFRSAAAMP